MRYETVSVSTQAEWDAAAPTAPAIDVLPGGSQLTLDLYGREPHPRIHVAGNARVTTRGRITLSCAGHIIIHDGATVELIPNGKATVHGGTVHARAGTVVDAYGGIIDAESGAVIFTPDRGERALVITMAPGAMWWDGDGAARLTKRGHTTRVTETAVTYKPITTGNASVAANGSDHTMSKQPSALERSLGTAVDAHTATAMPRAVTVAFATADIIVVLAGRSQND